ncbi:hypothetical protein OSC52_12360 [Clostridium pasteurianum]|uniref:hypothetical protein n=1 Tax=Clostridium pasteurianum TaxID=1501 RepID=UPI002260B1F2|nr:hypothetical protein [Clostridium pasteurianum]UZW12647.1 hypothetical protein OSC52_12360 [Clostridium pasteurianum]
MMMNLENKDIDRLRNLISNRIAELRYDINDEMQYGEDEIRKVIREYKALLKKINEQTVKTGVLK